ncbi:MAG: tRNA pseudouridine(55) synthase TruB [Lachnospiraceae bacterium]|nr:tRNA pseudouridine(55) synthase TruB [Lachnospiraceae bacterium]
MINGVINIYKIKGFTSHDVVAKLRGIMKQKKIGHTGTLDPDATGVLPVCLGSATKLCDMLTDKEKEYVAKVRLGVITDTQDMTGAVLCQKEVDVDENQVTEALQTFVGTYEQVPPMYSALKVNGKKLYELARAGKEVERKARPVTIHYIEVMDMQLPELTIRVGCSKGTYIRTLCHDLGERLGCGAAMAALERTKSGQFTLDTALTLAELEEKLKEAGDNRDAVMEEYVIPVDKMFSKLQELRLLPEWERLVQNGNSFEEKNLKKEFQVKERADKSEYRVYIGDNIFMGVYEYCEAKRKFSPVKMFINQ